MKAVPLINAQGGFAIHAADARGKHRRDRQEIMPELRGIPFHTAADPGISNRHVAGLKHRIALEQFPILGLVDERQQPPAQFRGKACPKALVLEDQRPERARPAHPGVPVLHAVRQHAVRQGASDPAAFLLGNVVRKLYFEVVLVSAEYGQWVLAAQVGGRDFVGFKEEFGHGPLAPRLCASGRRSAFGPVHRNHDSLRSCLCGACVCWIAFPQRPGEIVPGLTRLIDQICFPRNMRCAPPGL